MKLSRFYVYPPSVRPVIQLLRMIHSSQPHLAGEKWRLRNGLSRSGNEYGPLVSKPDWTYCDGRPHPEANDTKQKEKFIHSDRIKQLLQETGFKIPSTDNT